MVVVDDAHARRLKLADDVDVRLVTGRRVNPVSSEVDSSYRVGSIRLNDENLSFKINTRAPCRERFLTGQVGLAISGAHGRSHHRRSFSR